MDGKEITVASKALDGLEAAALRSGKGTKAVSDEMSSLSSSSSKAGKDVASASGAVDSLASASTGASKNVASAASNLGDLGSISSSASKNLQDTSLVIGDIAGGSTAASGSIRNASNSLNNMGGSADNAADAARRAAQETENVGDASSRASMSIKDIAVSLGLVAVASAAFNMLKSSLDSAISRFDTLVGFPVIMKQMGFSSEQATDSINKLSDGIQGLPTTLDGIVKNAQGIAILTGDLDSATETTLALNNAFLASGSNAANAERGLTQYVQMLSKGQVDMMSWRTLQETMGYALKETATAFDLASPNDLYDALKDGNITFDAFNAELIELNGGVGGFAELAKTSSAGIATSLGNLKNAVVVGVASMIISFDKLSQDVSGKTIAENLDGLKVVVKAAFKVMGTTVEGMVPVVTAFASAVQATIPVVKTLTPAIVGLVAAFAAYTVYSKASAAITAAKIAIDAARATTLTLTIATNARVASQVIANTTDRTGAAITVAQTGAITLKTFALGVMTGAIKLSATAQIIAATATKAWGTAIQLFAGPIGWVTLAIGLLVTGVIALVKWFNRSTEEGEKLTGQTEELASATNSLNGAVDESAKSYEKQQKQIETSAEANAQLAEKIEELAAKENKSGEEKKQLNSYIEELNRNVTGLNLIYGEESNALSMTSEQMANRINLMKEEEGLHSSQQRLTEIIKEEIDIGLQRKEVNALIEESNQLYKDGEITKNKHKEAVKGLEEQEVALSASHTAAGEERSKVEQQIIESSKAAADALENDISRQMLMYDELSDSQKEAVDGMKSKWDDYASAATDMFDKLSDKSKVSVDEMTKNLEENQRVIGAWSENIAKLAEHGIDEGLLETLRNAGPESAGLVNNLVNDLVTNSGTGLDKLSETFAKGGDVATQALVKSMGIENSGVMGAVGHLVVDTEQALSQAINNADFGALGQAVPEGTTKGIEAGTPKVAEASKKMADETEKAFKGAMDIQSPSGVFEKMGGNIAEGTSLGIGNGIPTVVEMVRKLAVDMLTPFDNSPMQFDSVGKDIMAGFNGGLIAGEAQVMATARRLAASVEIVMRKELDTHSPSKKTQKIGSDTGAGFVKGLQKKEKEIAAAAKKAAKAAVSGTKKGAKEAGSAAKKAAKDAESAAKKAEQAAAARYKEAMDVSKYKFQMGEIDSAAYIASLEKVRNAYAKTPDQVRQVNLEINNIRKNSSKDLEKVRQDELKAEQDAIKAKQEAIRADFENSKNWIDKKKYYNDLSLTEELAAWQRVQVRFKQGTAEREEADRNAYRVKKEINDQLIKMNEDYSKRMSDISKNLGDNINKFNEDVAKNTVAINKKAEEEIVKVKQDAANKSQAIQDKLIADQAKAMDDYMKQVESDQQRLNNFNGGLFNYFEMLPAESSDDLTTILQSQLDGLNEWEKQMEELSGKAIDEGLLEELRKMGPEALPELMAFNNMTEDQLEKYSAIYQEKSAKARALAEAENAGLKADTEKRLQEMREAANAELSQLQYDTYIHIAAMRQAADSEIAQMQNDAAQRINEMREVANAELETLKTEWVGKVAEINKATKEELDDLKVIGKNAGQGLLDGLASMEGPLVARATAIANAVKAAMASALDIHSPSRWMRDFIAGNMALGFIAGVDKNESKIMSAAGRFGEMMKPNVGGITIPNVNIRPFNPSFSNGGGNGGPMQGGNSTSYNPTFNNIFSRDVKTPSEVARANKRESERYAMEMGLT